MLDNLVIYFCLCFYTQRSLVYPYLDSLWLPLADGNWDNQESEINDFRKTAYHLGSNLLRQMKELNPDFPYVLGDTSLQGEKGKKKKRVS